MYEERANYRFKDELDKIHEAEPRATGVGYWTT